MREGWFQTEPDHDHHLPSSMPPSLLVKHVVRQRGLYLPRLASADFQPSSYTSKRLEALAAAEGRSIYIVEAKALRSGTVYLLACRFVCNRVEVALPNQLWDDRFVYRNSSSHRPAAGAYLKNPLEVLDPPLVDWLKEQRSGMTFLSTQNETVLKAMMVSSAGSPTLFS